jgi:hypothetical protein
MLGFALHYDSPGSGFRRLADQDIDPEGDCEIVRHGDASQLPNFPNPVSLDRLLAK